MDSETGGMILGGIGAAINAGTSVYNGIRDHFTQKQNFEQQESFFKRNWENFRENREYNTPANHAQRLKDAGFNPILAVTGGMQGAGAGGPVPVGSYRPTQAPHMQDIAGTSGINALLMRQQWLNAMQSQGEIASQRDLNEASSRAQDAIAVKALAESKTYPAIINKMLAEIIKTRSQTATINHDLDIVKGTPISTKSNSVVDRVWRYGKWGLEKANEWRQKGKAFMAKYPWLRGKMK